MVGCPASKFSYPVAFALSVGRRAEVNGFAGRLRRCALERATPRTNATAADSVEHRHESRVVLQSHGRAPQHMQLIRPGKKTGIGWRYSVFVSSNRDRRDASSRRSRQHPSSIPARWPRNDRQRFWPRTCSPACRWEYAGIRLARAHWNRVRARR